MRRAAVLIGVLVMVLGGSLSAQWLNYPDPRLPHDKDGKPILSAPAPRDREGRVDLSGVWVSIAPPTRTVTRERNPVTGGEAPPFLNVENFLVEGSSLTMLPAAEEVYRARRAADSGGRPSERCLPHGIPDAMLIPDQPFKILHAPGALALLYEEFNVYRQVAIDGRSHPKEMVPTWFGYSVGRWEGDTLVVDTKGFNDQTWLDDWGHPHTDAMRTIERFRRVDMGRMELLVTIEDAKAYRVPFTIRVNLRLLPDTDLIEHICENEKFASKK